MKMMNVLTNQLQEGMEISNIKELQAKTKFIFTFDGISSKGEIQHTCAMGYEKQICRKTIDTLMSGIYIKRNQLDIATKWLDGEMWENVNDKSENKTEEMIDIFNKLFDKIEKWEGNNCYLKEEEDYIESKEILLSYIKSK